MTASLLSATLVACILLLFMLYPRENTLATAGRSSSPRMSKPSNGKTVVEIRGTRNRNRVFNGPVISSCKPKGFMPPPSAPSRYANYNPLGVHFPCVGKAESKH